MCDQPGCNYGFVNVSSLNAHKEKLHPGLPIKVVDLACGIKDCDKRFDTPRGVTMHKDRVHPGWRKNAHAA